MFTNHPLTTTQKNCWPHQLYSLGHPRGVDLCHLPSHLCTTAKRCVLSVFWSEKMARTLDLPSGKHTKSY